MYTSLKSTNYKDCFSSFYFFLSLSPSCVQKLLWRLFPNVRTAQSVCWPDCMENDRRSVPDMGTYCNFNFGRFFFYQASHPVATTGHTLLIVKQHRPEDAAHLQLAEVTKARLLQPRPLSLMAATSSCSLRMGKILGLTSASTTADDVIISINV